MDEDLPEGGEEARGVLASWLDDYSEGRCDLDDVHESFLSVCRSDPDAPWDALALLDQYQRRGRIEPALAQTLKADIEKLVFGAQNPAEARRKSSTTREPPVASPQPNVAPADSTSDLTPDPLASAPATRDSRRSASSETGSGESGSQWPKLLAERDADSTRPGTAFADRTLLRPDVDSRAPSPAPRYAQPHNTPPVRRPSAAPAARIATHEVLRDRYELLAVLGRGAAGIVYRAVDRHRGRLTEAARYVAVKVLSSDYRNQPAALAELEREFHQAQSLAHPNIVSVFDLDRDGDTYFIVMELLEGRLLADILGKLEGRPMKREYALPIISSIGAALAHAHRRDMVHADLKPRNVMITTSGEVRVLDFGFARHRALDLHSASALHEASIPSPAYASVERVNGSEPDASDDVYSLACIAYELLSGQHPFGGRSALLARAHGRRPPRIRGLTHRQSQGLQRALLWTRGERKIDVLELLNALGCTNAPGRLAAPEEIMAPEERGPRWLRLAAWAACLIGAIAAVSYFMPRLQLRDASSLVTTSPAEAPAADPEVQTTGPEADAPDEGRTAAAGPAGKPSTTPPVATSDQGSRRVAEAAPKGSASQASAAAAGAASIEFEKDTFVATERDGSVRLLVKRSGSTRRPATFHWSLRGNSAEAGADFAAIGPGTEQIPAGAREASLTIPLVSDALVENTELFLVELQSSEAGVSVGERSHAAVIVVDDD
ncbi:MAG: protein kinase domain-containing protein [Steroidobacter sp.]